MSAADPTVSRPDLIVDTNVLIELYSVQDLKAAYEAATSPEDARYVHRLERARDALLFSCACDRDGLTTGSLLRESIRILKKSAPPEEESLRTYYVTIYLWFIRDYVLPGMEVGSIREIDDSEMSGDQCDEAYLQLARDNGLPLITEEGNSPEGIRRVSSRGKPNLRQKAESHELEVLAPGEFWRDRDLDVGRARDGFLGRFDRYRPEYVRTRGIPDDGIERALDDMREFYRSLFDSAD